MKQYPLKGPFGKGSSKDSAKAVCKGPGKGSFRCSCKRSIKGSYWGLGFGAAWKSTLFGLLRFAVSPQSPQRTSCSEIFGTLQMCQVGLTVPSNMLEASRLENSRLSFHYLVTSCVS